VVELPVYQLDDNPLAFTITRINEGEYRVSGKRIERAVAMTYWDYDQAVTRFQRILETMGITAALEEWHPARRYGVYRGHGTGVGRLTCRITMRPNAWVSTAGPSIRRTSAT